MLFSSPVYSQVSGSIAGLTYSHGRSGMVVKPRGMPVNPNTTRQRAIRYAVARLGAYWGQILTADQRAAWRLYALNVPMKNALGQTIYLHGLNHFLRSNIPRLQAGVAIVASAPTIYDLGTFTPPTILSFGEIGPQIQIAIDITDEWTLTTGSHMLVYCGRPTGPSHKFYRHPWRYAGRADGAPGGIVSPVVVPAQWPWQTTIPPIPRNIAWIKCRISTADGRLSLPIILGPEPILLPP